MNRIPGIWRVKRLGRVVKKELAIPLLVKWKGYNIVDNHYIFSDPRGGSTWLMEIIKTITKEPVIWEPFQLGKKAHPFKKINFGWRQHIPEDAEWKEAKELFDKLFSGKILADNILNKSTFSEVMKSKSLLFKICRGSDFLIWLSKNYYFNYKPIYLIRHPFAVVSSQLRHGSWNYPFTKLNIPNTPYNDKYKKHRPFLETLRTKEEALVAEWCLANYDPLNHKDNNKKWLTINYEELIMNPEKTINRILASWGIEYDLSLIDFKKNSSTTKDDSPDLVIERLYNWQNQLNKTQLENMGKVLDYFKIDIYSKENPLPEKIFNYGLQ